MIKHQLKLVEATTTDDFEQRVYLILDEIYEGFLSKGETPCRDELEYHLILDRINKSLGTIISRNYIERECWNIHKAITGLWMRLTIKLKLNSLEGSKTLDGKKMHMNSLFKSIQDDQKKIKSSRGVTRKEQNLFYVVLTRDRELLHQYLTIRGKQWEGDEEVNRRGHQLIDDFYSSETEVNQGYYEYYCNYKSDGEPSRHLKYFCQVLEDLEKKYGKGNVKLEDCKKNLKQMYLERQGEKDCYQRMKADGKLLKKEFIFRPLTQWCTISAIQAFKQMFIIDEKTDIVVFNPDGCKSRDDNGNIKMSPYSLSRVLNILIAELKYQYPELALRVRTEEQKRFHEELPKLLEELTKKHKKTKCLSNNGRFIMSVRHIIKWLGHKFNKEMEFPLALYDNPKAIDAYVDLVMEVALTGEDENRKLLMHELERIRSSGEDFNMVSIQRRVGINQVTIRRRYPEIYEQIRLQMSEDEKDLRHRWYFDKMGYAQGQVGPKSISWKKIEQLWFLTAVQKYVKHLMRKRIATGTISSRITHFNRFSRFLTEHNVKRPEDIDRNLMVDFLSDISHESDQPNRVGVIKEFFEYCRARESLNFKENLLFEDDRVYRSRDFNNVRFIPDSVMEQLTNAIPQIGNEVYERFWSIMLDTGKRVGELINCEFDCLREVSVQDDSGNWTTEYNFRVKMYKLKRYNETPIDETLVKLIRMQQDFVRKEFPQGSKWLFPQPLLDSRGMRRNRRVGDPIGRDTLVKALKLVIKANNITDENGLPYHFKTHDIRHTFANTCLRGEMSIVTVQKLLGHISPEMTLWYAKQSDDQNRKQWREHYQSRLVSITGESVATNWLDRLSEEDLDIEWMRHNLKTQALPNGLCALPKKLGDCPHANACLTCTHFRTDYTFLPTLKDQFARTNKMVAEAKKNGWERQVEMNTQVATNLNKIINGLEKGSNDNTSA